MAPVPDFVPFRALRFAGVPGEGDPTVDLSTVCAPPYDVIDPDQRDALAASDAHNMVRIILPDSYADAAAALDAWRADATLVRDDTPSLSVYRMTFTGDDGTPVTTTGVIGLLALEPGGVLPHERTLPKAKSDRLELLRATRANLEPVWGISLADDLTALLAPSADVPP